MISIISHPHTSLMHVI